jgi:hypothetical protein
MISIYKTKLVCSEFIQEYIGLHGTDKQQQIGQPLTDGYVGSGDVIKAILKQSEFFKTYHPDLTITNTVLSIHKTREQASQAEIAAIEECRNRLGSYGSGVNICLNIADGGSGCRLAKDWNYSKLSQEAKKAWQQAGLIYDYCQYMGSKPVSVACSLRLHEKTTRKIINKIKEGWIPNESNEWLTWCVVNDPTGGIEEMRLKLLEFHTNEDVRSAFKRQVSENLVKPMFQRY